VEIGALRSGPDGTYTRGDVLRSQVLEAFEEAGITLEQIQAGIEERSLTLDYLDQFYPDPGPRSGHTYAEFEASLGPRARLLAPALAALGLPHPSGAVAMRVPAEQALRSFLEAWDMTDDDEVVARAAHLAGEGVRAMAEGWVRLFYEVVSRPLLERQAPLEEVVARAVLPAERVAAVAPELIGWLLQRHMQRAIDELNVEDMERELVRRGRTSAAPTHAPAVAFVDLSSYTQLTEELGDESAARAAVRLSRLADRAATAHEGRVVKLLGDGVLLTFPRATNAVHAALDLAATPPDRGLPPVHAGVAAGPLISRDGDVYGHTVNLAARIAATAAPGQVLVSETVVAASTDPAAGLVFEPLGRRRFKGVARPEAVALAGRR